MVSSDPEDLREEVYLHGSLHTTIDCLTKTFTHFYSQSNVLYTYVYYTYIQKGNLNYTTDNPTLFLLLYIRG